MTTPVLDMTAGSRMFWWNKNDPRAIFIDKRDDEYELPDANVTGGLRRLMIHPDIIVDWRKQQFPFADNTFYLVVFDPPHLLHAGKDSWLARKYGVLDQDWPQ